MSNFQPFEIVDRGSETQPQVVEIKKKKYLSRTRVNNEYLNKVEKMANGLFLFEDIKITYGLHTRSTKVILDIIPVINHRNKTVSRTYLEKVDTWNSDNCVR